MRLGHLRPDTVTYTACISACAKQNRWEQVVLLLSDMVSAALEPNTITWVAALDSCAQGRGWETALALLIWMQRYHYMLEWATRDAAIKALSEDGRSDEAVAIYREAQVR